MALETTVNTIRHIGDGVSVSFPYDFRVDRLEDMNVLVDDILVDPAEYTVLGLGDDNGGSVDFNVAPDPLLVILARIVPLDQQTVYPAFGPFPAQSHEAALDKLTMIDQQNLERIEASLRMPIGDDGLVVLPVAEERAEKFLFFDAAGNATVFEAELAQPAVLRIDVQDGSGGEDSRDLMQVEVISGGPNFPKVGFRNINKPFGPLQLNEKGNVPFDNLGFGGLNLRGPYRGDDLCDKPGDEPLACEVPDTRNPSERFPELDPDGPDELGKFKTGDMFIVTIQDPEVSGTMNLLVSAADEVPSIVPVNARDGLVYITGWDADGVDLPGVTKGWYLVQKLVDTGDASFISYDPVGNVYVLGINVQVALDDIDDTLVENDAYYLVEKNANRIGLPVPASDLNATLASGLYAALAADGNVPSADDYAVTHIQHNLGQASQSAMRISDSVVFTRTFTGAWGDWVQLSNINQPIPPGTVMLFRQSDAPVGWTKSVSAAVDNRALRVVTGDLVDGGSVPFTTAFANYTTGNVSLSIAQTGSHTHTMSLATWAGSNCPAPRTSAGWGGDNCGGITAPASGTSSSGSGAAHNHALTLAVQFVDIIIAVKD